MSIKRFGMGHFLSSTEMPPLRESSVPICTDDHDEASDCATTDTDSDDADYVPDSSSSSSSSYPSDDDDEVDDDELDALQAAAPPMAPLSTRLLRPKNDRFTSSACLKSAVSSAAWPCV